MSKDKAYKLIVKKIESKGINKKDIGLMLGLSGEWFRVAEKRQSCMYEKTISRLSEILECDEEERLVLAQLKKKLSPRANHYGNARQDGFLSGYEYKNKPEQELGILDGMDGLDLNKLLEACEYL